MQYIIGRGEVVALELPKHRQHEDVQEGKRWNHLYTPRAIIIYRSPVDMSFLPHALASIIMESHDPREMIHSLRTVATIKGVDIHVMYVDYRDQLVGRNQEGGIDKYERSYGFYQWKTDKGDGQLNSYHNDYGSNAFWDFNLHYGIPDYVAEYLDRKIYNLLRLTPGDEHPDYKEARRIAIDTLEAEAKADMLNPQISILQLVIDEPFYIEVEHGQKPDGYRDIFSR